MRTPLLGCMLALVVATACAGPRASWRTSPLVEKTVEISAKDVEDDRTVRVSPNAARLVVVDFWATWCEPCREQLPFLDRLATEYRARGVEVYAIAFDEDLAEVKEYVARSPVGFTVLWDKGGAALAERLEVTRLPTTVLIDGTGVVRGVHLGFDAAEGAALEAEVGRLLAE